MDARGLRANSTSFEQVLWEHLRDRRLDGLKFRRQHPLGRYVVDFYCASAALVVELDGAQHLDDTPERDAWLRSKGLRVVRIWNTEVTSNLAGVLDRILEVARS